MNDEKTLALIEDWAAIEDVCLVEEGMNMLRWLHEKGVVKLGRVFVCAEPTCGKHYTHKDPRSVYCSVKCNRKSAWRRERAGMNAEQWRAYLDRNNAFRRAHWDEHIDRQRRRRARQRENAA